MESKVQLIQDTEVATVVVCLVPCAVFCLGSGLGNGSGVRDHYDFTSFGEAASSVFGSSSTFLHFNSHYMHPSIAIGGNDTTGKSR